MSNLNFDEKLKSIMYDDDGKYPAQGTVDQIKQLISEIVGEVDSLEEVIEDGKRYLKDKKGNKTPFGYPYADTKEKYILEELRNAFNLKEGKA